MTKVYRHFSSNSYSVVSSNNSWVLRSTTVQDEDEVEKTTFNMSNCIAQRPTPASCLKALEILISDKFDEVIVDFADSQWEDILNLADEEYVMKYNSYLELPDPVDEDVYVSLVAKAQARKAKVQDDAKAKAKPVTPTKAKAKNKDSVQEDTDPDTTNTADVKKKPISNLSAMTENTSTTDNSDS